MEAYAVNTGSASSGTGHGITCYIAQVHLFLSAYWGFEKYRCFHILLFVCHRHPPGLPK